MHVIREKCLIRSDKGNWQKNRLNFTLILLLLFVFLISTARGASIIREKDEIGKKFYPQHLLLPFAFYNETFNFAYGLSLGTNGFIQDQMRTFMEIMGSSNSSFNFSLLVTDYKLPFFERLFFSPVISFGKYGKMKAYTDGNPDYSHERAGSNDSDEDNYMDKHGWDSFVDLNFNYVLPVGAGKASGTQTFILNRGFLEKGQTGGDIWNPFRSGITTIGLRPFYRYQSIDKYGGGFEHIETNGLKAYLEYNNTDFFQNPTKGSYQRIGITRDWGWFNSTDSWTLLEAELCKYFSLGASKTFRQRVIALDFWTAETPTWDSHISNGKEIIRHRAPYYMGTTLGGLYRMRAYPRYRFSDRAAIYYSAELRLIPKWHPLGDVPWIKKWLQWDYWQVVPFVEVGRVADEWSISELHRKMKIDGGIGIRAYMRKIMLRLDIAFSDEGGGVTLWVGHPFQFQR